HRGRTLGDFGKREARDQHRAQKIFARGISITSDKLGLVGKTNRMDYEIERAPSPAELGEDGVDGANVLDVAREHEIGFDGGSQRLHALAERLALIGKC